MNKKYELKVPTSTYIQVVGLSIILILHLFINYQAISSPTFLTIVSRVFSIAAFLIIVLQVVNIIRSTKVIEINENSIRADNIVLHKQHIDKIIIQGYFVQSIGIKLKGKRLVSFRFYFRFKHNEEEHIRELKQWAEHHSIQVVSGKIYRWI